MGFEDVQEGRERESEWPIRVDMGSLVWRTVPA